MKFNLKHCFVSVLKFLSYSFVSSLVFGAFAVFIWFTCRFVGFVFSFLGNSMWELTLVSLIGSTVGFFVGIFLTILKGVKSKEDDEGR